MAVKVPNGLVVRIPFIQVVWVWEANYLVLLWKISTRKHVVNLSLGASVDEYEYMQVIPCPHPLYSVRRAAASVYTLPKYIQYWCALDAFWQH